MDSMLAMHGKRIDQRFHPMLLEGDTGHVMNAFHKAVRIKASFNLRTGKQVIFKTARPERNSCDLSHLHLE